MPESSLVMYLFGERDPEMAALLRERSFQRAVGELFGSAAPALPPGPPAFWDDALRLDLLATDGPTYRPGGRLVLIPAAAERAAVDLLRPALERYVEITGEVAVELRMVYGRTAAAERFSWPQVSHSIVAGLFLDLAVGREVLRAGRISRQATGDAVVWAFQGISAENAYGISLTAADPPYRALFAELWHRSIRPAEAWLSSSLIAVLARVAQGEQAGADFSELKEREDLLVLKFHRLVRTVGGSLQLQVPAFCRADAERLLVPLERGARCLVAGAIVPALQSLERDPWWREGIRSEAYRHAALRLILEHGIDRVISAGVCDPFPVGAALPLEWGRWLWQEPEEGLLT